MLGSLRFRVPALFLLGIVLFGLVAAAIALRLVAGYVEDRSIQELQREARGIAALYADAALRAADEGAQAPDFVAGTLEDATGSELFYIGVSPFPGQDSGLQELQETQVPPEARTLERQVTFEFVPPRQERTFVAVAQPLRLEPDTEPLGAIIVAKPGTDVREQWLPLAQRLALAFLVATVIAGLLGWWLSRRITGPVLALADAADAVAEGNYDVRVPAGRNDEIGQLSRRFNQMTAALAATEQRERQFLMSVSHELRTPLTAIKGHVDALRDGLIDEPELVAASLDVVAAETVRLERLVGDVLDLAKLNADRFTVRAEEVDVHRLVEQAYGTFAEEARRREIEYHLVEDGSAPTLVTDGDRVLQVVSNLLANAFRWTPDGGRVELAAATANGDVRVDVSDTGPGIRPEEREAIFVPFISADHHGTGLGLPIARELALALGGRIELDSEVGRGSTFRLVLPLTR
jgi:signal transduction histidine kinase